MWCSVRHSTTISASSIPSSAWSSTPGRVALERAAFGRELNVRFKPVGRAALSHDQSQSLKRIDRGHHRRFEHADAVRDLALRQPFFTPEFAQHEILRQ
jgi:hypothetical protein